MVPNVALLAFAYLVLGLPNASAQAAHLAACFTLAEESSAPVCVPSTDSSGTMPPRDIGQSALNVKDPPFSCKGDGVSDDTACLQAAIDASYGRRLVIPRGDYRFVGPLSIEVRRQGTSALPLIIAGDGFDGNGGNGGTILRNVGDRSGIEIVNRSGTSADNLIVLSGFALIGDGSNASGGDGIYAKMANNLNLVNLWIQDQRENGVHLLDCWGANVDNLTILRSRRNGLFLDDRFNMGVVRRVRAYGNGRIYDESHANIRATGRSKREHLGARFEQVDVSYAGNNAFRSFRTNSLGAPASVVRLLRIVVRGSQATAITASPHLLHEGDRFAITGATTDVNLNSSHTYSVAAVPAADRFTFSVRGVHDGTYVDRTLKIQPSSFGMLLDSMFGVVVANSYAEDCSDNSIYLRRVTGFEIVGGYFQNQMVHIADGTHGRIAGAYFTGHAGGLALDVAGRSEIDVSGSNAFADHARLLAPSLYKADGRYMGLSAPTTGAWTTGDQVWNSAPVAGGPPGWVCVGSGTPGTWKAMPPLAP